MMVFIECANNDYAKLLANRIVRNYEAKKLKFDFNYNGQATAIYLTMYQKYNKIGTSVFVNNYLYQVANSLASHDIPRFEIEDFEEILNKCDDRCCLIYIEDKEYSKLDYSINLLYENCKLKKYRCKAENINEMFSMLEKMEVLNVKMDKETRYKRIRNKILESENLKEPDFEMKDIIKKYNINYTTFHNAFPDYVRATRHQKRTIELVKKYKSGKYTQIELAQDYGISKQRVSKILKEFNL